MATTPIPNMNPTGVIGSGAGNVMPGQTGTGFSAFTGTGGAGNYGFGNSMNPQAVYGSGTAAPGVTPQAQTAQPMTAATPAVSSMNPGGTSQPTGTVTSENSTTPTANPYGQSQSQQNWTEKYLQETYGGGMGSLIYQYLMSGGGYNSAVTQQAVDAQTQAMQQQTQLGANNLKGQLGAMGVSGSSSEMAGALTNYENQALTQQNAITAQEYYNMWNQSNQLEANMMQFAAQGTGTTLANKSNWMDWLSMGEGMATSGAEMAILAGA
jgi:hypothetical protein